MGMGAANTLRASRKSAGYFNLGRLLGQTPRQFGRELSPAFRSVIGVKLPEAAAVFE